MTTKLLSTIAMGTMWVAAAIAQKDTRDLPDPACAELNRSVMAQAAKGHLAEAEALLPRTTISAGEQSQGACTGIILGNMARTMAVLGRIADAERLAERSVRILENLYPPNDQALLRPLQVLAAVRLESGKTARAREALLRIRSIPIERPEDSALVHVTRGALLQVEGRPSEAEPEYRDALRAYEEDGRGESADAAAVYHHLAALYLKERRLDEARQALDRALAIHDRASDSLPVDRMNFLHLRAVLHGRLGEWHEAEQDLRDALSIADRLPYVEPDILRMLLDGCSYVLRKNRHRREAQSIEARRAALPPDRAAAAIVDSTQLLNGTAARR